MKFLNTFVLICLVVSVLSEYAAKDDNFTSDGPSKFKDAVLDRTGRVKRDCWNYLTGSRCDNEGLWSSVGFDTCEQKYGDGCRKIGFKGGAHCSTATESCMGFVRNAKVCKCVK